MSNRAIWSMGWGLVTYLALGSIRLWPFSLTFDVGPMRVVLPGPVTMVVAATVGLMLYRGRRGARR